MLSARNQFRGRPVVRDDQCNMRRVERVSRLSVRNGALAAGKEKP